MDKAGLLYAIETFQSCSLLGPFCELADRRSLLRVRQGKVLVFIKPLTPRWLQAPPQRLSKRKALAT